MAHAFTYGSLMSLDIMARVCGLPVSALKPEPALLTGHTRHPVRDQAYPGLVPSPNPAAQVAGVLYRDLPDAVWARLDRFEGPEYRREGVALAQPPVQAWVYVYRPELRGRLLDGDWDVAEFHRSGKARFEAQYLGFDTLD